MATAVVVLLLALSGAPSPPPDPATPLRQADLGMARAVAARDPAAFAGYVDEEAIWGGPHALLEGRGGVATGWARYTNPGGPRLTWAPTEAVLSESGDLGYTVGTYRWEGAGPDGQPAVEQGRYLTVWRRGRDGAFRALFDMGIAPAAPDAPARATRRQVAAAAGDLRAAVGTWTGPRGERGSFLVVFRRGEGGGYGPAVEALVPFVPAPGP